MEVNNNFLVKKVKLNFSDVRYIHVALPAGSIIEISKELNCSYQNILATFTRFHKSGYYDRQIIELAIKKLNSVGHPLKLSDIEIIDEPVTA